MLRKVLARLWTLVRSSAPMSPQDWVTVSISLILAVTLWFIVTLNTQSYKTDFQIPVRLTNFPGEYQLLEEFPSHVSVSAEGPGIKLLYEEFDATDTLVIDYIAFNNRNHFIGHENLNVIGKLLQDGLQPLAMSPDSISLRKLPKKSKKVPVRLAVTWNLPASFRLASPPRLSVDSVLVTGPSDSLDRITFWPTASVVTQPATKQTNFRIPMDTMEPFAVVPNEIQVEIKPEPFTEIQVPVPVRATGLPRFTELYFEPDTVVLRYLVPLASSDSIDAEDFQVEVDYSAIDARSQHVLPRLVRSIPGVEVVGLQPQRVKYLIITKIK